MRNKPFLICFTGIDGSGKTSQAKRLRKFLLQNGVKSKYVWNRYDQVFLKPFMRLGRLIFMRGRDLRGDYTQYTTSKRQLLRKSYISRPFWWLFLAEYWVQAFFKIQVPYMLGNNIICDRYMYDPIMSIINDYGYEPAFASKALRFYQRVLPRPDLVFVFDLPADVAFKRKTDTISLPHLEKQRVVYRKIAEDVGAIILDGERPFDELAGVVQEKVAAVVRGRQKEGSLAWVK